jgi:hypothetical protein
MADRDQFRSTVTLTILPAKSLFGSLKSPVIGVSSSRPTSAVSSAEKNAGHLLVDPALGLALQAREVFEDDLTFELGPNGPASAFWHRRTLRGGRY